MIHYSNNRNIYPLWALAEYCHRVPLPKASASKHIFSLPTLCPFLLSSTIIDYVFMNGRIYNVEHSLNN